MRAPRTITVDMSARNGTRWSSGNWLNVDLARITDVNGMLPLNHFKDRSHPNHAFTAWLDKTVSPETFEVIMANETAFAMAYAAYKLLAQFQARMNKPNNREAQPAESNNNV